MKARRTILWVLGAVVAALMAVGVVFAFGVGNVDGVWGIADTNGATCDGWASMTGDSFPWSTELPSIQSSGGYLTDENQVRYGVPVNEESCPNERSEFVAQSGFGFDGVNGVVGVDLDEPFYLGSFTHYNNPIYSSDNDLDYVDLALSVPVDCDDNGSVDTTFEVNPRFLLDETSNDADPCAYPAGPNENGCADQVLIQQPPNPTFTCGEVEYTVNIYGFTSNADCATVFDPDAVSTEYLTAEQADNTACLWAEIDTPLADVGVSKQCGFGEEGLIYEIRVVNSGPGTALGATITDTLPSSVLYASYASTRTVGGESTSQGTCVADGQDVVCSLNAALPETVGDPTAEWLVEIYVTEDTGSEFLNEVWLATTSIDNNPDNNYSNATCDPTAVELVLFTAKGAEAPWYEQWLRVLVPLFPDLGKGH